MPTILLKKSDTPGSVPGTANLTNLAGGAEVAVNTADKRMFSMTSASAVVELGTNPSSLTCADGSFVLLKAASASITNLTATSLVLSNLSIASANITTLTSSSATISTTLALSGGTANGVLYLNGSKVATSGSGFTYDGTSALISGGNFRINRATNTSILTLGGSPTDNWEGEIQFVTSNSAVNWRLASNRTTGGAFTITPSTAGGGSTFTTPAMTIDNASNVGIGTSSPAYKLHVATTAGYVAGFQTTAAADYRPVAWFNSAGNSVGDVGLDITNTLFKIRAIGMPLVFGSGADGTDRMRLDSSGNLLVGNTSSVALTGYTVVGQFKNSLGIVSSNDEYAGAILRESSSSNSISLNADPGNLRAGSFLSFGVDGTERARIDSSGNLGLGVTPSAWNSGYKAFEFGSGSLMGRATNTDIYVLSNTFLNTSGNFVYKSSGAAGYYGQGLGAHQWFTAASGTAGNAITFTQAMTLDASGNLGVGVTSPGARLDVAASSPTVRIHGTNSSVGLNEVFGTLEWYTDDASTPTQVPAKIDVISGTAFGDRGEMRFFTNSSSALTERARITSGGDLLVNNTATLGNCRVEITDSGNSEQLLISGASQTGIQIRNATGGSGWIIGRSLSANNANDFFIFDAVNNGERLFINTTGEVIISGQTDNGAYNLQCNGTGVWGAGAYVNGSDERIKEDIAPLASGLDVVEKLNPVTYRYKESWSKDQSTQTGFIAQELLTALDGEVYVDGVVQQGGAEGYYSVAYQNIIPILTKAIQEQQAMINELKAKVAALETK